VRLLLESGLYKNSDGRAGLHWAAGEGHEAIVRLLLENGVDKESTSSHGRRVLHLAAENGHEAVVRLLLHSGVNKEAKGYDG
jgi:ankyrin repeat protein